jgi:hypothetical protein
MPEAPPNIATVQSLALLLPGEQRETAMLSLATKHRVICVSAMMERLGIDPSGGTVPRLSLLYATAVRRCESCPCKRACRDWLDRTPAIVSSAPPFCPLGDILFELQFSQPWMRMSAAAH